ncbi:MAG TPA: hypothetical protein VK787_09870 [Puia sp.]|jgi:hypothetical protein|nr:hypothetical protein [Puia sp.]
MKNLKLLLVGCLAISVAIISCSKGPAGPAGATGATGAAGANGSNGANGTNGTNGTDSVLHSAWITLTTTVDTFTTTGGTPDSIFVDTLTASAITQAILDSGVVLGYVQNLFNNDGSIVNVSDYAGYLDVTYRLGEIDFAVMSDITGAQFRYVIIPGAILTQSAAFKNYTKQEIKGMDFATATRLVNEATTKTTGN